jgi:hypothetical protein
MSVQQIFDVKDDINRDGRVTLDVGGFDYIIVQLVSPVGTATFKTTNDAGAITGVSDGSAASAANFIDVQGTNLNSGSAVTSLAASGMVKFSYIGQFFRIEGPGLTVTKAIIRGYKIN